MVEFSLKQLQPKIWHLHFSSKYDLTLHFFRFQEYYESIEMRGKDTPFVDLMENYAKKLGNGAFTYTHDWDGFNLPGEQIFRKAAKGITDKNRYDELMISIAMYIKAKENTENFYIIGTSNDDPWLNTTFNHELAHGLFYANSKYKKEMKKYVEELPKPVKNKIFSALKKWGYNENLYIDETQAYLATGLQDEIDNELIYKHQAVFKKTFNIHAKGIKKRSDRNFDNSSKYAVANASQKKTKSRC